MREGTFPSYRRIRRYAVVARAAPPIFESYVGLVRAEAAFARKQLKPLLIASTIAVLCGCGAIAALVSGAVIALRLNGIRLLTSIVVLVIFAALVGVIAGTVAYRCIRSSTFRESRERLSWIVQALYD